MKSNTQLANEADRVTYWKLGRAVCRVCLAQRAYVAAVDVKELECPCGGRCDPAHEEEG